MKFKEIKTNLKKYIKLFQCLYGDKRTPLVSKILLWMAIAYFFMPFDLIPDFIPVLGQLDDAVIVPGLLFLAYALIPKPLYYEYHNKFFK